MRLGRPAGRNGGFAAAALTHGFGNGLARWPEELDTLDRLGAREPRRRSARRSRATASTAASGGHGRARRRDATPTRSRSSPRPRPRCARPGTTCASSTPPRPARCVDSPTYLAGLLRPRQGRAGRAGPARVGAARGLPRAWVCGSTSRRWRPAVHDDGRLMAVETDHGTVRARHVALATNAFPSLLRRLRLMTVPVYDYVLMTEPLSAPQRAAIGWHGRRGRRRRGQPLPLLPPHPRRPDRCGAATTRSTTTAVGPSRRFEQAGDTHETLARHFLETFPQLEGVRFTHRWGGRHRHLHALRRLLRHGVRRPGRRTPWATPASASPPPASAPT